MQQNFEGLLVSRGPKGAWTHMAIPFNVEKVFGSKARVPVRGTINGFPFRTSIMPRGDGTHYMAVNKDLQAGAKAASGEKVKVTMKLDPEERTVAVPDELQRVLKDDGQAAEAFRASSYSHQKEYADWVATAKRPETRVARAVKAAEMLRTKKPLR